MFIWQRAFFATPLRGVLGVVWLLLFAGCGSDRPETVPVTGQVTLDGGAWPNQGIIIFTPVEPAKGLPRRPGRAAFDREGNFTASSYDDGDGLVPGRYRAAIHCGEPIEDDTTPTVSHVPIKYQTAAQSDWEIVVEPGSGGIVSNFDVRSAGG